MVADLKGSGIEGDPVFVFLLIPLNGLAGAGVLDANGSGTPCVTVLCCLTARLTNLLVSSAFRPPDLVPENPLLASKSAFTLAVAPLLSPGNDRLPLDRLPVGFAAAPVAAPLTL